MSKRKNKIELRDASYSLRGEMEIYYQDDPWYYDDYDYSCDCPMCRPFDSHEYKYLPNTEVRISNRMRSWTHDGKFGAMIDMTSIYSKEMLRQKKIDEVLGLSMELTKPTFADIINNDK